MFFREHCSLSSDGAYVKSRRCAEWAAAAAGRLVLRRLLCAESANSPGLLGLLELCGRSD